MTVAVARGGRVATVEQVGAARLLVARPASQVGFPQVLGPAAGALVGLTLATAPDGSFARNLTTIDAATGAEASVAQLGGHLVAHVGPEARGLEAGLGHLLGELHTDAAEAGDLVGDLGAHIGKRLAGVRAGAGRFRAVSDTAIARIDAAAFS